jgi:hypothetical protein
MQTFIFHHHDSIVCIEMPTADAKLCSVYNIDDPTNRSLKGILIDEFRGNDKFVYAFSKAMYLENAQAIINHSNPIEYA